MSQTAIITGGTGGLGSAVVGRLLDDGWRVVVPWIVERELERLAARDGLVLVRADLFDPAAVASDVTVGVGSGEAPLRGLVNLVGGFAAGARVHETPIEEFERQFQLNLRPTYLMIAAAMPHLMSRGGRLDRVRRHARGAAAILRRSRLHRLEGGGDRIRRGGRRRIPERRDALQLDPAERDRHPREPRVDAERGLLQVGHAGRDRGGRRTPSVGRLRADERRRDPGLRARLSHLRRPTGRADAGSRSSTGSTRRPSGSTSATRSRRARPCRT